MYLSVRTLSKRAPPNPYCTPKCAHSAYNAATTTSLPKLPSPAAPSRTDAPRGELLFWLLSPRKRLASFRFDRRFGDVRSPATRAERCVLLAGVPFTIEQVVLDGARRADAADETLWVNWLWAWENPHPDKAITGVHFEPKVDLVVVSAISVGKVI